jgi:8-oxo-dGTP diphosphatase
MYHPNLLTFGVPGGHLEAGEELLDAALRELEEETGLTGVEIEPRSFWLHGDDAKVILGFSGTLDSAQTDWPEGENDEYAVWVQSSAVSTIKIDEGYRKFILSELGR